jgi:hypothetical protein
MTSVEKPRLNAIRHAVPRIAATLAAGPIFAVITVVAVYHWFSEVKGFDLGPMAAEALQTAWRAALLPALICGGLMAALDKANLQGWLRVLSVPLIGFLSAFAGLAVVYGTGDGMGLMLGAAAGVFPALGCEAVWLLMKRWAADGTAA